jgi:hypothetical protein
LLNVIAVVHAVVTENVAKAPKFLNDVGHLYLSSGHGDNRRIQIAD